YLASDGNIDILQHNDSYTRTLTVKARHDLTGPWYVLVSTDPPRKMVERGQLFESDESNNVGHTVTALLFDQPPPAELAVETVSVPESAAAGSPVSIQWKVKNPSANPATASWTDVAYLSTDAILDGTDRPIGRVIHSTSLDAGAFYTASLAANLPAVKP